MSDTETSTANPTRDPADVERLNQVVALLDSVLNTFEVETTDNGFLGFDLETLASWFDTVDVASRILKAAHQAIAERVSTLMPQRNVLVNGVSLDWGEPSGSVVWDDIGLLPILLKQAREERQLNEDTGEIESEGDAFLRLLRECAAIGYFRANKKEHTGLYAHAINPDDWRTRNKGPRRAKVLRDK